MKRRLGQGDRAASGAEDEMKSLQDRQVVDLATGDDMRQNGWSRNLIPVAVEDELVRRALHSGAEIEIVNSSVPVDMMIPDIRQDSQRRTDAAAELDTHGGVAALPRFN